MSLKAKLATTIAALCMVICLLTVGVWAASRTSVGFSGTVSFTSKDVNATITGTITGATGAQNVTNTPVATFNGSEAEPAEGEYTPAQAWTIGNLDFATKDSEIVITLNIKNDNTERAIQIDSFTAKLGTQDLTAVEGDEETVDLFDQYIQDGAFHYASIYLTATDLERRRRIYENDPNDPDLKYPIEWRKTDLLEFSESRKLNMYKINTNNKTSRCI